MNKFENINFYDFYFNGKKLSDFNGYVGSVDGGLKTYSLLPARQYVTARPINTNVTTVYATNLEPRVFEVPIIFEQLNDGALRTIASWLDTPNASEFYFIGDDVYINASLDANTFDATSTSGQDAQIPVKFICHDPFFYKKNITQYIFTNYDVSKLYEMVNNGYDDAYPLITIACSGNIKIEIFKEDGSVYTTTNITDIVGGVKIDCKNRECTLLSSSSHFNYIDTFPVLPKGKSKIKISGTSVTNCSIEYRERYL